MGKYQKGISYSKARNSKESYLVDTKIGKIRQLLESFLFIHLLDQLLSDVKAYRLVLNAIKIRQWNVRF